MLKSRDTRPSPLLALPELRNTANPSVNVHPNACETLSTGNQRHRIRFHPRFS
jgi:hypothetical protein